jgi:hypothetical protein
MELDVTSLEMLPCEEPEGLRDCLGTCIPTVTCGLTLETVN